MIYDIINIIIGILVYNVFSSVIKKIIKREWKLIPLAGIKKLKKSVVRSVQKKGGIIYPLSEVELAQTKIIELNKKKNKDTKLEELS